MKWLNWTVKKAKLNLRELSVFGDSTIFRNGWNIPLSACHSVCFPASGPQFMVPGFCVNSVCEVGMKEALVSWSFLRLFQATGLHFRHTDNVIQWLNAMSEKGLPKVSRASQPHCGTDTHQQNLWHENVFQAGLDQYWSIFDQVLVFSQSVWSTIFLTRL